MFKRYTSPLGPPCRRKCSNGTRPTFEAALLQKMLMQRAGGQTIFATDRSRPIWARLAVERVQTRYLLFGAASPQKMFKWDTFRLGPPRHRKYPNRTHLIWSRARPIWGRSAIKHVQTGHAPFGPALPKHMSKRNISHLEPPCRRKSSNGTRPICPPLPQKIFKWDTSHLGPRCRRKRSNGTRPFTAALS